MSGSGGGGDALALAMELPGSISSGFAALAAQTEALRAYALALDAGAEALDRSANARRVRSKAGGAAAKTQQTQGQLQRNSTLRAEAANEEEAELIAAVQYADSVTVTQLP